MRPAATCFIICLLSTSPAFASDELPLWSPSGTVASISFPVNGDPLQIPVHLNGRDLRFIVDTGSSTTVISDTQKLGDSIPADSGPPSRPIDSFSLAGVNCPWLKSAIVVDLDHMKIAGIKTDGIVGVDVLSRFVVHFDFDNGKMLLIDPAKPFTPLGDEIPLTRDKFDGPCVSVTLPGSKSSPFLVDTGNLLCMNVIESEFDRLTRLPDTLSTGLRVQSIDAFGELVIRSQLRCRGMQLADKHRISGVVVIPGEQSSIGLQHLARFRVTLDFHNNKSYWHRGRRFGFRDRADGCGLSFKTNSEGKLDVLSVTPRSLSWEAGLQTGDCIEEINGHNTKLLPDGQWYRLLSFPRADLIKVAVRRNGELVSLNIAEN